MEYMNKKKEFIEFMMDAGVLTFGDFVTKSGRNTPYFVNTGNYKTGKQIATLGRFYADCIVENMKSGAITQDIAALFGPAYKGIPIAVSTTIALSEEFGENIHYCFNRKEAKDHGEGGTMVGYMPADGDSILIVEDVITAGTAIRECFPVLKAAADVNIQGLIISVDRMEKGSGEKTAIQEIYEEFGIKTFPIITVRDILDYITEKEQEGHSIINSDVKAKMEKYLDTYCIK
jgi:orotate phosphoribosyltransferase